MKKKLIIYIILCILLSHMSFAIQYFVLDINYIQGSVTFNSVNLRDIDRNIANQDTSGFLIKTFSFNNAEIQNFHYDMTENKNYIIYVPYSKDISRIEVYNPKNSKIIDLDVSSFSDTCGNKICEPYESYESCTKDCVSGSKDDFCDGVNDGICDPDCTPRTDSDCSGPDAAQETGTVAPTPENKQKQAEIKKETYNSLPAKQSTSGLIEVMFSNYTYLVYIISGIFFISFIILLFFKQRENKIINTLKKYIDENLRMGYTQQQIEETLFRQGYKPKEVEKAIKATSP